MPVHQLDEYKTRQRAVWDTGEYGALSPYIADVGELVVARAKIEPGMSVLDVACGTGNAARPAARAEAHVIGLDLTPKLLEAGRAKARAEGLEIASPNCANGSSRSGGTRTRRLMAACVCRRHISSRSFACED